MKPTLKILIAILIVMLAGVISSNIVLKNQYDSIDKSDIYWTYDRVLSTPFKHLKIEGGNATKIFYEPHPNPSLRLSHDWVKFHGGKITSIVKNDTLFVRFDYVPANEYEKFWTRNNATIRIFSPELRSVTGNNTKLVLQKFKQKTIDLNLSGKSKLEVECMFPEMDSIRVWQEDTSSISFQMSPEYNKKNISPQQQAAIVRTTEGGRITVFQGSAQNDFNESMSIKSVTADLNGYSIFDIGHAQIQNLQLKISDSAAIVLSGGALKKQIK